jgi:hypothetical protein
MQTYAKFAPSTFDTKGLGLPDRQDWLVVIGVNRDSDCLTRSNWAVVTADLEKHSPDVETHEFGHWACGWLRVCIVRPDSPAHVAAEEWHSALADYLVADESHFSDLETNEAIEYWASMRLDERRRLCVAAGVSKLVAYRATNLPDRIWERLTA